MNFGEILSAASLFLQPQNTQKNTWKCFLELSMWKYQTKEKLGPERGVPRLRKQFNGKKTPP